MIDEEVKDDMVRMLEAVFVSGSTYMFVVWGMFILGVIIGAIIW